MGGTFCCSLCYFFRLNFWPWGSWGRSTEIPWFLPHVATSVVSEMPDFPQRFSVLFLLAGAHGGVVEVGLREGRSTVEIQPVCSPLSVLVAPQCWVLTSPS